MEVIAIDENVPGGTPCFKGTRVPSASLFDCLKDGYTLAEYLADFPSVKKEQAEAVLDIAENDVPSHAVLVANDAAANVDSYPLKRTNGGHVL
jgi:uncharacterized protein (DUF433 family)